MKTKSPNKYNASFSLLLVIQTSCILMRLFCQSQNAFRVFFQFLEETEAQRKISLEIGKHVIPKLLRVEANVPVIFGKV